MANKKASIKDIRKSAKNAEANRQVRSRIRTLGKKVETLTQEGAEGAAEAVAQYSSALDKAAKRNIIHKNKASRLKGQSVKALAGAAK